MEFTDFIHNNDKSTIYQPSSTQTHHLIHLQDPYLRRYHITKTICESTKFLLAVWTFRILTQNASYRNFRCVSPWIEISVALSYLNYKLYTIFYRSKHENELIKKQLNLSYHKQHFGDSQYWH